MSDSRDIDDEVHLWLVSDASEVSIQVLTFLASSVLIEFTR